MDHVHGEHGWDSTLWSFDLSQTEQFGCSMVPAMFEFDSDNGHQQAVINEADFTKYQVQYSRDSRYTDSPIK